MRARDRTPMISLDESCRVLCVEDDPLQLEALAGLLRLCGAEVAEAGDLATARTRLADGEYDLILCDYNLPDGTADDLLDDPRWEPLVVVVTAAAQTPTRRSGGAVVTKPLTVDKLRRVLRESSCKPA